MEAPETGTRAVAGTAEAIKVGVAGTAEAMGTGMAAASMGVATAAAGRTDTKMGARGAAQMLTRPLMLSLRTMLRTDHEELLFKWISVYACKITLSGL